MSKPANFVSYPDLAAKNLAAGETSNPVKRVDGVYFDDNNLDTNNALSRRGFFGIDCVDNGSSASECRLTVQTAAGNGGLVRAGDEFIVSDGTGWWRGQATGADDIRFSAADRIHGTDPVDFSTAGFIDSLEGEAYLPAVKYVGINEIATGNHPNAINGDNIPASKTDSTSLTAKTAALDTRVSASLDSAGAIKADAIVNDSIDDTTYAEESFRNEVANGGMEEWNAGTSNPPTNYTMIGGASAVQSTDALSGGYSALISSGGIGQGMGTLLSSGAALAGKDMRGQAYAKLASGTGSVRLVMYDGITHHYGDTVILTSNWQRLPVPSTINSSASAVEIWVESTTAPAFTFTLDELSAYAGKKYKGYAAFTTNDAADDVRPHNLLFPRSFQAWNNGNIDLPDGWEEYGTGTLEISRAADGLGAGLRLRNTTANATGIKQSLGGITEILDYLKGKTATFSIDVMGNGTTNRDITIEIDDGVSSTSITFASSEYITAAGRVSLTHTFDSAATEATVSIYYSAGSTGGIAAVAFAAPLLNIGSRPALWTGSNPSIWNHHRLMFTAEGTVTPGSAPWNIPRIAASCVLYPLSMTYHARRSGQDSGFPPDTITRRLQKFNGSAWVDTGLAIDSEAETSIQNNYTLRTAFTDLADVENAKIDYDEVAGFELNETAALAVDPADVTVTVDCYSIAL